MKCLKILRLLFFLSTNITNVYTYANEPSVLAQGAILLDQETGRILWGKNEEEPLAMASTAKIITAILVLEKCGLDDVVYVSRNAVNQPKVNMNMQEGEMWTVGDLLHALMLGSYNDSAVALAEHAGGTVENFCTMMTDKAKELGAENTKFASPNGLDSHLDETEHYSTAYDMAKITAYAIQNQKFLEIIKVPSMTITELNQTRSVSLTNPDIFLTTFEGALGVKTGYTNRAGHCFVGAATREDKTMISVVLGSGWGDTGKVGKWTDTNAIMTYGFDTFEYAEIINEDTMIGEILVQNSKTEAIEVGIETGYTALFSAEELEAIEIEVNLPTLLEAPIEKGIEVGQLQIVLEGEVLKEIPIVSQEKAEAFDLFGWLWEIGRKWLMWD